MVLPLFPIVSENDKRCRAFNLGCDARLFGVPIKRNPYSTEDFHLRSEWVRGWSHVEKYWGADVKEKWDVKLKELSFVAG